MKIKSYYLPAASVLFALNLSCLSAKAQDVPIAAWSGRLILPSSADRHSDGSVIIEVQNAPSGQSSLIGKQVRLVFNTQDGSREAESFASQTKDVVFNQTSLANKNNLALPVRLNGWLRVSPLESLAGAHQADDVTVELDSPQLIAKGSDAALVISKDPVILDGSREALVQFVRQIDVAHHEVRHYNAATRAFDGRSEVITLDFQKNIDASAESSGLDGIEAKSENKSGWMIYGDRVSGTFVMKALESYRASLLETKSFDFKYKDIDNLQKDDWKITADSKNKLRKSVTLGSLATTPHIGDRFLVVHAFGSWNDNGQFFGFYQGHAAYGEATAKRHPITGELFADIVYTQIYCHSNRGIVAGRTHAHAYQGDLYRGRMFYRPINDVLVSWPKSFTTPMTLDARTTTLREDLLTSLNNMARDYRIGFGHGLDQITVLSSCAHDSGNILIKTIANGQDALTGSSGQAPELASELRQISKAMGPAVEPPADYRDSDLIPANVETLPSTRSLVSKNMTIVAPRNLQDATVHAFANISGARTYAILSVQVASDMTTATPHAPDVITMNKIIFKMVTSKLGQLTGK